MGEQPNEFPEPPAFTDEQIDWFKARADWRERQIMESGSQARQAFREKTAFKTVFRVLDQRRRLQRDREATNG